MRQVTDELRDERRVITAKEAETELGIPAATVRSWAHRRRLFPVSIGPDAERWYLLAELLKLAATRRPKRLLAEDPRTVQH